MFHSRHYTLTEARAILPEVKRLLSEIVKLKADLDSDRIDIYKHPYFGGAGQNGSGRYPDNLEILAEKVSILSQKGILLKGLESGLIDFPHLRKNGEEVYLCYKFGENDILFWHGVTEGYAGRKSVEEL